MVPDGWSYQRLDEASKIIDCKHRTPPYVVEGVPVVSPGILKWGNLDLNSPTKRVSYQEYLDLMDHCSVETGDLVIGRNQSVGIASYVDNEEPFVLGQDTVLVKPNSQPLFLFYALQSTEVQRCIYKLAGGSTFSRINLGELRKLPVLMPPISEQSQISEILSTWDRAIETVAKLIEKSEWQKKALMQKLLTGTKRLFDKNGVKFSGEWKRVELGFLLNYKQPTSYLVESAKYSDKYEIPVLTAGKTFILGFTNEDFGIYQENLPVIIFDDFTTASKFVDFPFKAKSSAMKILTAKKGVSIKFVFEAMQMLNFAVGGHQRHWISIYSNLVIPIPEKEEQEKIAAVLSAADQESNCLQKKLDCLNQEKKALMQQLLTGKRRVKVGKESVLDKEAV